MPKIRVRTTQGATQKLDVSSSATVAELRRMVGRAVGTDQDPQVSLNKQAGDEETIASVGICSGDLLWVLTPPDARSGQMLPSAQQADEGEPLNKAAYSANDSHVSTGSCNALPLHAQPADVHMPDAHEVEVPPASTAGSLEAFRQLLQKILGTCGKAWDVPAMLTAAIHAAMLNREFQPNWASQESDDARVCSIPKADSSTGLAACLTYSFSVPPAHSATPPPASAGDSTHAMQQCLIRGSRIGPFMIFAAQVQGSPGPSIQLKLTSPDILAPSKPQPQGLTVPKGSSSMPAPSAACPEPDNGLLAKLFVKLETELVLPITKRCYAAAGQALPSGLLGLRGSLAAQPRELLSHILSHLDASSLAVTACVCSELRQAASAPHLWQSLYRHEFGELGDLGAEFSIKAAFRERWVEREEMRQAMRRRHPLHSQPPPIPGWFGPQVPGHFPMPPGITGGDYDRLPQPFMQGSPGLLGGPLRQGYRHQGQGNGRGFGSLGGFRMH